jgi:hypothetical protein
MFLCIKNIKKIPSSTPFISRDVPKSLFLQKRIKKNVNKHSYVLKICKNPLLYPIYLQGHSEKSVPTQKNKKER